MSFVDGISVGGQSTRDRGFTPVMSVAMLSSLCNCLASTNFGSTVAMCLPARDVAKSLTPTTASTETISLCVARLTAGTVFFPLLHVGAKTTIEEIIVKLNVLGQTASMLSNENLIVKCLF